ncbi:MAG: hypothetical protein LH630_08660 [Actinomycetia bacterium]|nr:hypothetical protein [Actinomycetes bacterium]
MSRPEPRPALRRSGDGAVHPAAPRVAAEEHIHPAPHAPSAATKQPKKNKGVTPIDRADDTITRGTLEARTATFDGKPVELTVLIPKDLRKQVRKTAERAGTPIDSVVVAALIQFVGRT